MLCTVAIRRIHGDNAGELYSLRLTGKTSLGPSGTGGRDTKENLSADEVHTLVRSLGLEDDVSFAAQQIMNAPEEGDRFTPIAEDVQVPFEVLERADFYLFD